MFEKRDPSGKQYKTYHVTADEFDLDEGEIIQPGIEIGVDAHSGISLRSGYWGRVATIYYNPMDHSFLVMISQESRDEIEPIPVFIC
jgi:hypothetical protein